MGNHVYFEQTIQQRLIRTFCRDYRTLLRASQFDVSPFSCGGGVM